MSLVAFASENQSNLYETTVFEVFIVVLGQEELILLLVFAIIETDRYALPSTVTLKDMDDIKMI